MGRSGDCLRGRSASVQWYITVMRIDGYYCTISNIAFVTKASLNLQLNKANLTNILHSSDHIYAFYESEF
jgi:hypothetical protein